MSHNMIHGLPATPEDVEFRGGSVLGPVDRDAYSIHKHRKPASTGGGRAWTEEEEAYLLRTRSNKMPYKHIAAHLNKTELACRLHYHQMSYGSNRRKRTGSVSSTCSTSSYGSSFNPMSTLREHTPDRTAYTALSPVASPPSSPDSMSSHLAPLSATSPTMPQRPILPKPIMTSRPTLPSSIELSKSLHLDTSFAQHREFVRRSTAIDMSRLQAVYASHREGFWSQIAAHYSLEKINPAELEEAFLSSPHTAIRRHTSSPPTPEPSPQTGGLSGFRGFQPVNTHAQSPTERCAVNVLLN